MHEQANRGWQLRSGVKKQEQMSKLQFDVRGGRKDAGREQNMDVSLSSALVYVSTHSRRSWEGQNAAFHLGSDEVLLVLVLLRCIFVRNKTKPNQTKLFFERKTKLHYTNCHSVSYPLGS